MRNWKRALTMMLCLCMIAVMVCPTVEAKEANKSYTTYYADGSYTVTTITYDEPQSNALAKGAKSMISGSKKRDYYNSSNTLLWTFRVHGTFTYDGRSAKATAADYSYDIYDSAWRFNSGSASCSGATATATGRFTHIFSTDATLNLTCSANGTLS